METALRRGCYGKCSVSWVLVLNGGVIFADIQGDQWSVDGDVLRRSSGLGLGGFQDRSSSCRRV